MAALFVLYEIRRGRLYWDYYPTFFAYFLLFATTYILLFIAIRTICRRLSDDNEEGPPSVLFATIAFFSVIAFFGARPDSAPTLSEFVTADCRPRTTLVPYSLANPRQFWIEVEILTERALEDSEPPQEICAPVKDRLRRADCIDWVRLRDAQTRFCRRHAQREKAKYR